MNSRQKRVWGYRVKTSVVIISAILLLAACSNPADDKPKATVNNPAAESSSPPPAQAETLPITPENSKVEFIGSNPREDNPGSFKKFTGQIELVGGKPEGSRVSVDIDTASVETEEKGLSKDLKSADFFDVAKFPKATFASTEIKPGGERGATHTVTGNLELHGVKKTIAFPATITVTNDAATMNSEFVIDRKDFGIVYPGPANNLIRDEVVIKLSINAPRSKRK